MIKGIAISTTKIFRIPWFGIKFTHGLLKFYIEEIR
jgi:hypothetical protein